MCPCVHVSNDVCHLGESGSGEIETVVFRAISWSSLFLAVFLFLWHLLCDIQFSVRTPGVQKRLLLFFQRGADKMSQWGREGLHADMWSSHDLSPLTSTDPDLWPLEAFGPQICSGILSDLGVLQGQKQRTSGPLLQGQRLASQSIRKEDPQELLWGLEAPATGTGVEERGVGGGVLRGRVLRLIISMAQIRPCQLEANYWGQNRLRECRGRRVGESAVWDHAKHQAVSACDRDPWAWGMGGKVLSPFQPSLLIPKILLSLDWPQLWTSTPSSIFFFFSFATRSSPGWPQTCYVSEDSLELLIPLLQLHFPNAWIAGTLTMIGTFPLTFPYDLPFLIGSEHHMKTKFLVCEWCVPYVCMYVHKSVCVKYVNLSQTLGLLPLPPPVQQA
jgi:hypothetical protein